MLPDNGPTALMDALTEVDDRFMKKAGDRASVFVILTGDGSENSKNVDEQGFNRWIADIAKRGVSVSAVVLKTTGIGLPDVGRVDAGQGDTGTLRRDWATAAGWSTR